MNYSCYVSPVETGGDRGLVKPKSSRIQAVTQTLKEGLSPWQLSPAAIASVLILLLA